MSEDPHSLSIVVVGASGDLARRKIFPALFALHCQGFLPAGCRIFGFARSAFTHAEFRERITEHLTCRYVPGESCADRMAEFLAQCFYAQGNYDNADAFVDLHRLMREREGGDADRVFYLAVPPSVFLDVAHSLGRAGLVLCGTAPPWSRVVIEKPFGRDRLSSDRLTREMAQVFTEAQTYRIDHYLGKEVIQNLMVLRFANLVFEPIWNRDYVESVKVSWKENIGVAGRGGYFDGYGIIRDVMQNHLLQILSLVAMEPPSGLASRYIRDEKVKVLGCIPPVTLEDIVTGQFVASGDGAVRGYVEDDTVPDDSLTPTFAAVALKIRNRRWDGVPFLMQAGKGLDARMTEIRIRMRAVPADIFGPAPDDRRRNELVIRVQPDEAIYLTVASKVPGMGMTLQPRNLDLRYKAAFSEVIPDAYESLLLDVLRGEKGLFIRKDELEAAWDVFTPVLRRMEAQALRPEPYPFGSAGPPSVKALAARHGIASDSESNHGNAGA